MEQDKLKPDKFNWWAIGVMLLALVGIGLWGYYVNQSRADCINDNSEKVDSIEDMLGSSTTYCSRNNGSEYIVIAVTREEVNSILEKYTSNAIGVTQ